MELTVQAHDLPVAEEVEEDFDLDEASDSDDEEGGYDDEEDLYVVDDE
jgi:hypothetical protein